MSGIRMPRGRTGTAKIGSGTTFRRTIPDPMTPLY